MKRDEISKVFQEWYTRYSKDPAAFNSQFDDKADYGDACADYFLSIAKDLGIEVHMTGN